MGIFLIGEDGKKIGDVTMEEAKRIAQTAGKSLIMVDAKKNIYRVADEGKLKYEQKQKERSMRAQKRTYKIKEIKLRLSTEQHDLDVKVSHIREFLLRGLKTKVTMQFKGREQSFKDVGIQKLRSVIDAACAGGIAVLDKEPVIEGRSIIVFLTPSKQAD
jgi:translation initiation factor IF-3